MIGEGSHTTPCDDGRMRITYALGFVAAFTVGCSAPPTQVITGRIAPGFPMTVTTVKVKSSTVRSWDGGNADIATAPVAADGTFRLDVMALDHLHLHLIGDGQSRVVFPRQAGTIDTSFAIRGEGADFDLGAIYFVGTAETTPIVFKQVPGGTSGEAECDDDGQDPNGAMCVDDDDDNHNTCGQNDEEDDDEGEDNDDEGEHEDGDDEDGENDDGDQEDQDDGPEMGDALAEHNFPSDGCSDDDDDDDDDDDHED